VPKGPSKPRIPAKEQEGAAINRYKRQACENVEAPLFADSNREKSEEKS
jgi:hypothetical protein